jgi:hypothetical protein
MVEIWYDDQNRFYTGSVVEYDSTKLEDNALVRWGNYKCERITLNIEDCTDNIENKDRFLFLMKKHDT